jgi:hypothetical protein
MGIPERIARAVIISQFGVTLIFSTLFVVLINGNIVSTEFYLWVLLYEWVTVVAHLTYRLTVERTTNSKSPHWHLALVHGMLSAGALCIATYIVLSLVNMADALIVGFGAEHRMLLYSALVIWTLSFASGYLVFMKKYGIR